MRFSTKTFKTFPVLFLALLVLFSCSDEKRSTTVATDVPQLLDRNEKIQLGKEWDFVQNLYAEQIKKIDNNKNPLEAKFMLAQLFVKEARVTGEHGHYYPAALMMTDEILDQKNLSPDLKFRTLMTKAGIQLSLHEFKSALETGQKAIALNSNNAQAHGVLVDAYVELGEYEKAVNIADRMINIKPDIRSYSRVSYLREIHGDYNGAVEAMTMAVKAGYPGYEETAWAMQTLGELYMLYGENEKAEKVFQTILKEREDYPFAVAALGALKYKSGDLKKAEQITKEAISIIPEVGFYTQLAQIYKDQGRTKEFDELMEEVFVMLEDDVIHGHNMNMEYADVYLNLLKKPEIALEYAMIEFEKRPKNIDVNLMMAEIYNVKGNVDKKKEFLTAASITQSIHPTLIELKEMASNEQHISSI